MRCISVRFLLFYHRFIFLITNKLLGGTNLAKGHSLLFCNLPHYKEFCWAKPRPTASCIELWRQHQRAKCGRQWLTSNHIMSWAPKSLSKPSGGSKQQWGLGRRPLHHAFIQMAEYCGAGWVDWPNWVHSLSMNIWKLGLHVDVGSNGQWQSPIIYQHLCSVEGFNEIRQWRNCLWSEPLRVQHEKTLEWCKEV